MSFWSDIADFFGDLFGGNHGYSPNADVAQGQAKQMANAEGVLGYVPAQMSNSAYGFSSANMMLGGLGSGLAVGGLGLLGSIASSAMSYAYQKKLLEKQDRMQRQFAADAPGITKSGMEKAGINPLVGTSGTTSSEPLNAGSQQVNLSGGLSDAINAAAAFKSANTNASVGKSTVDLNKTTEAVNRANVMNNTAKTNAEIYNDIRLTDAKVDNLKTQTIHNKIENKILNNTHGLSGSKGMFDFIPRFFNAWNNVNSANALRSSVVKRNKQKDVRNMNFVDFFR